MRSHLTKSKLQSLEERFKKKGFLVTAKWHWETWWTLWFKFTKIPALSVIHEIRDYSIPKATKMY